MFLILYRMFTLFITILLPQLHLTSAASPNNASATIPPNRVDTPEDLTLFNKPQEAYPGLFFGSTILILLPCEDPECRRLDSSAPRYRCRNRGGTYHNTGNPPRDYLLFGCHCCPRLVWCDDLECVGSSDDRCISELLAMCLCWRRGPEANEIARVGVAPAAAAVAETAESENTTIRGLEFRLYETSSHSDSYEHNTRPDVIEAASTPASGCPDNPPVKCYDPQCRGADDWQTLARCNHPGGMLFIENTPVSLIGCPCCPDFIECDSSDCSGDPVLRTCLVEKVKGCLCNWPKGGAFLFSNTPTSEQFLVNTFDSWMAAGGLEPGPSQSPS
jgi:hypothetical protein